MRRTLVLLAASIVLAGGIALAQGMPKLPADRVMRQTGDSPGKVTFSHQNHVGFQAKADCTACHPKLAPIMAQKAPAREVVTHAKMEKGHACGACHDGKAAHGFEDCASCHKA